MNTRMILAVLAVVATAALVSGRPLIYEPFADPDSTLTGNTSGEGLTGTWSGDANYTVVTGSNLTWGVLVTDSNYVDMVSGQANIRCLLTTDLSNAGLLDHGTSLWFSMIVDTPTQGGTNPDTGFAFGTAVVGDGNNLPMGGDGFGWTIKNDALLSLIHI